MKSVFSKFLRNVTAVKPGSDVLLKPKSSYSQCGEDLLVQYIFYLRDVDRPSYIDIGAHHPFVLNNTAIFYQRGCRGINIEANPALIEKFALTRPGDINLNFGVGAVEGELDFYFMSDPALSTFSKNEADNITTFGKYRVVEVKKLKILPLHEILDRWWGGIFPDFLTIDVEGMDLEILKSIDFTKSYPKVICIEAADYSPIGAGARRHELIDFLVSKGYYEYANTNLNAIMVHHDFWFI